MGLTALHLEILAEEAKARPFSGTVVTCGVLDSKIKIFLPVENSFRQRHFFAENHA